MVKRLKHESMENMDTYGKPKKRYHQTKMDRRHESEGMKHEMKRESEIMGKEHRKVRKKYHQTKMDRMHESEGMRKHNRGNYR